MFMSHQEFMHRWRDLIFTPIDIPGPPCDPELIAEFMADWPGTSYHRHVIKSIHGPDHTDIPYDPNTEWDFFQSFVVKNSSAEFPWHDTDFQAMFPDVSDWIQTLPMVPDKNYAFGWVAQLPTDTISQTNHMNTSMIHTDETGSVGLRWFKQNTDNNLYFYETKQGMTLEEIYELSVPETKYCLDLYHSPDQTPDPDTGLPRPNEYFKPQAHKVHTRPDTGFMLQQQNACHVIKKESQQAKYTFIVEPVGNFEHRWDWYQLDQIVTQSIDAHPTEVIWRSD
jgi:hypothetical protein